METKTHTSWMHLRYAKTNQKNNFKVNYPFKRVIIVKKKSLLRETVTTRYKVRMQDICMEALSLQNKHIYIYIVR